VGYPKGREFTGTHGDGSLTSAGNAKNSDWSDPSFNDAFGKTWYTLGSGLRGGSWNDGAVLSHVSSRSRATIFGDERNGTIGGRCARTAPK